MILYVFLAIIYIGFMIIEKPILKIISRKSWSVLLIFPLFFMNAFKNITVGSDTSVYNSVHDIFIYEPLLAGRTFGMEIGYRTLIKIMGWFNISFFGFQIIYSFFVYAILIHLIIKYSKNISFSVFVFLAFRFFFFSMTGIRQMLAMSIILYATKYIVLKKPVKYIVAITLASSFHISALISILLYPLPFKNFKFNYKNILKISIISLLVLYGANVFLDIFVSIFPKYSVYLSRMENHDGIFVYLQTGIILVFLLIGIVFQNKSVNMEQSYDIKNNKNSIMKVDMIFLNAMIFGYILNVFSLNIDIANRLSYYFTIYLMFYLPNSIENIKNQKFKILIYYIIVFSLLFYFVFIMLYRPGWDGVIPYELVW